MNRYLIGFGVICQLFMAATYVYNAMYTKAGIRTRIQYSAMALLFGTMAVILVIGLVN